MKLLITLFLSINYLFAINIGTLNINKENTSISLANDIKKILNHYDINLTIKENNNSIESIENIINNQDKNYFAIVNKDTISKYNEQVKQNKTIYSKIPVILSLDTLQLHLFTNSENDFDFDIKKDYNVYCGEENSNSCTSAKFIEKMYNLNFTFISSNIDQIQDDLISNKIDIFISVKKAPAIEFESFKNIKLIDLPTNFKMEDMYTNTQLLSTTYSFLDEDIHVYSVKRAIITNLKEKKYQGIINNIIKILVLNKKYLIKKNPIWEDVDFNYTDYKKFLKSAKRTIMILQEQKKRADALRF
jgi:hypothetical protein